MTDRPKTLNACGYRVMRFWNGEVLRNPEGVPQTIAANLDETPTSP